jgi:hypothetical protein
VTATAAPAPLSPVPPAPVPARTSPRRGGITEWPVWATVAASLLLGLLLRSATLARTDTVSPQGSGVSLAYPARWVVLDAAAEAGAATGGAPASLAPVLSVADLNNGGAFGAQARVFVVPRGDLLGDLQAGEVPAPGGTPLDAATAWSLRREQSLVGYRVLGMAPATVQGREAVEIEFAYLAEPAGAAGGAMPALVRGVDALVPGGDRFYVLSVAAEEDEFGQITQPGLPWEKSVLGRLRDGWRVPA